jgi:hypothetical protein
MNPYNDNVKSSNSFIREFKIDVDDSELVWHRDKRDRIVKILSDSDWQFQFDNQLPFTLVKGTEFKISKEVYHRVIKNGDTDLIIKITEF